MKLTLQIKLLPTPEQGVFLKKTMEEANAACNEISDIAFDNKLFNQFRLQREVYHSIKSKFSLSAQMTVRCISKVVDAYNSDKTSRNTTKREFRPHGAITYDPRILSYKINPADITVPKTVSLWTVGGRIKHVPFVCHNEKYLPYIKGEADLVFKKNKFYLFQTVEIPDEEIKDIEEFIGCDFGQTDICVLDDGTKYNSEQIKKVRKKYSKVRASVQAKGTKGAKKLLKRLSGRERRFVSINNHTISKQIVAKAKTENKGIAVEDLTHIRKRAKSKSKAQKTELNRWSFFQLRQFLTYKAAMAGVKLVAIPPAYTSQTCNECFHIGDRNGKSFSCKNCGYKDDADVNAARNIATWGCVVNQPEKSSMFSCALHYAR